MNKKIHLFLLLTPIFMLACTLANQVATTMDEKPDASPDQSAPVTSTQSEKESLPLTVWQEPQTGAFTANVPTNWLVNGGLNQSAGFYHPWLEMAAPDGRAAIVYGNREMQIFILPQPALTQAGYPEGSTIQENGLSFFVNSYLTGEQAAEKSLRYWVQPICTNLTIDYLRNLNTYVSEGTETSEGMAGFHCLVEGNQMVGKYVVATHKIVDPTTGAGIWFSGNPASFVALESYAVQAEGAFSTLRESLTFNQQWQAELAQIPGVPGLYYGGANQNNTSDSPFFEDQVFDFCIQHGMSC